MLKVEFKHFMQDWLTPNLLMIPASTVALAVFVVCLIGSYFNYPMYLQIPISMLVAFGIFSAGYIFTSLYALMLMVYEDYLLSLTSRKELFLRKYFGPHLLIVYIALIGTMIFVLI